MIAKLAGFALVLCAVFGVAAVAGNAVGPGVVVDHAGTGHEGAHHALDHVGPSLHQGRAGGERAPGRAGPPAPVSWPPIMTDPSFEWRRR